MTDNISKKNKKDWENFLSSSEKLHDKDLTANSNKTNISKSLDLHGFSLEEANKKVESFLNSCFDQGVSKVIIVTGKGLHSQNEKDPYVSKDLGILKYSVPEFIKSNNELMSMINDLQDAEIEDGGSGAFYIYLKKNKKI